LQKVGATCNLLNEINAGHCSQYCLKQEFVSRCVPIKAELRKIQAASIGNLLPLVTIYYRYINLSLSGSLNWADTQKYLSELKDWLAKNYICGPGIESTVTALQARYDILAAYRETCFNALVMLALMALSSNQIVFELNLQEKECEKAPDRYLRKNVPVIIPDSCGKGDVYLETSLKHDLYLFCVRHGYINGAPPHQGSGNPCLECITGLGCYKVEKENCKSSL